MGICRATRITPWIMDIFQNTRIATPTVTLRAASWLFLFVCLPYGQLVSAGTLAFSTSSYSVAENASNLTITVNRTGSTVAAAAVTVVSEIGSAGASDFTAVSQALSWAIADSAAKTFTISILDDAVLEGSENFTLKFTGATGDSTGSAATVVINDYEEGKLQFSASTFSGEEGSLAVVATINRVDGNLLMENPVKLLIPF